MLVDVQRCAGLFGDLPHRFVEPTAGIGVHLCASLLLVFMHGFRTAARCAGISLVPVWERRRLSGLSAMSSKAQPGSLEAAGYQQV